MSDDHTEAELATPSADPDATSEAGGGVMLRRWLTFLLGVWIMSIGIALSVHSHLGTAPVSTFPAVLDAATPLTVGFVSALRSLAVVLIPLLGLLLSFS